MIANQKLITPCETREPVTISSNVTGNGRPMAATRTTANRTGEPYCESAARSWSRIRVLYRAAPCGHWRWRSPRRESRLRPAAFPRERFFEASGDHGAAAELRRPQTGSRGPHDDYGR